MIFAVDTNVLVRLVEPESRHHMDAKSTISTLLNRQDSMFVFLQQISEFWNVCTRPTPNNGLGLSLYDANIELTKLEQVFDVMPGTLEVYQNWRKLVVKHSVAGIKVHDAKIVAAMMAHGIDNLLTFNVSDFQRFDEISVVSPDTI